MQSDSYGDSSCSMKQYTEETTYFEDGAFNDINSPSPRGATHGAGTLGNAFPPPTPLHSPNPETPLHSPKLHSPKLHSPKRHSPPPNQFASPKPERMRAISTSSFADSGASTAVAPTAPTAPTHSPTDDAKNAPFARTTMMAIPCAQLTEAEYADYKKKHTAATVMQATVTFN